MRHTGLPAAGLPTVNCRADVCIHSVGQAACIEAFLQSSSKQHTLPAGTILTPAQRVALTAVMCSLCCRTCPMHNTQIATSYDICIPAQQHTARMTARSTVAAPRLLKFPNSTDPTVGGKPTPQTAARARSAERLCWQQAPWLLLTAHTGNQGTQLPSVMLLQTGTAAGVGSLM